MKIKCKCGKLATWYYMPDEHEWACCDNCVPRGCTCNDYPVDGNYENSDPKNWKQELDEEGREFPCCEWWYNKEGWDEDE